MGITRTTTPTSFPIDVPDAKRQTNITFAEDDLYLQDLIEAVTDQTQRDTKRQWIQATYVQTLAAFDRVIRLEVAPVISVTSVEYIDFDGVTQTLSTDIYDVVINEEPALILLADGQTFPTTFNQPYAVTITFEAGYETVPPSALQAIRFLTSHWYQNRESQVIGASIQSFPETYQSLIASMQWDYGYQ